MNRVSASPNPPVRRNTKAESLAINSTGHRPVLGDRRICLRADAIRPYNQNDCAPSGLVAGGIPFAGRCPALWMHPFQGLGGRRKEVYNSLNPKGSYIYSHQNVPPPYDPYGVELGGMCRCYKYATSSRSRPDALHLRSDEAPASSALPGQAEPAKQNG